LLGASHESSTWATVPDGNFKSMNATSGIVGITQPRLSALACEGVSSSQ
jgi:hypothetical protein